jgi:hypothetical protein
MTTLLDQRGAGPARYPEEELNNVLERENHVKNTSTDVAAKKCLFRSPNCNKYTEQLSRKLLVYFK